MTEVFYFAGCLLVSTLLLARKHTCPVVARQHVSKVAIFCIGQATGAVAIFAAVELISLSSMAAICMGSVMILGVLLGKVVLKENITLLCLISVVTCVIGESVIVTGLVLTIVEGDTETNNQTGRNQQNSSFYDNQANGTSAGILENPSLERNIHTASLTRLIFGIGIALVGGLGEAISFVSLKRIQHDVPSIHILTFWFTILGIVSSTVAMLAIEFNQLSIPQDWINSCYLIGHVIMSSSAIIVYILAIENSPVYITSIFINALIPIDMFLQYVCFPNLQPMKGSLYDMSGAILVTVGLLAPPVVTLLAKSKEGKMPERSDSHDMKRPILKTQ